MDQWLRGNIKHAPDSMSDDEYKAYERCREELREIINNSGLNLDQ
jgi:predicted nucleic acid-binding Zn ribbon protein